MVRSSAQHHEKWHPPVCCKHRTCTQSLRTAERNQTMRIMRTYSWGWQELGMLGNNLTMNRTSLGMSCKTRPLLPAKLSKKNIVRNEATPALKGHWNQFLVCIQSEEGFRSSQDPDAAPKAAIKLNKLNRVHMVRGCDQLFEIAEAERSLVAGISCEKIRDGFWNCEDCFLFHNHVQDSRPESDGL